MPRKIKVIIGIVLIIVVVIVVLLLLFGGRERGGASVSSTPATETPQGGTPSGDALSASGAPSSVAPSTATARGTPVSYEATARSFVERYGSYSNQSNFENIEALYPFMTDRMRRESKDTVAAQRSDARRTLVVYSGVTTRVLSLATISSSVTVANVRASTQRTQSGGTIQGAPRVSYQDIELSLLKVGEEWKIDSAVWK